MVVFWIIVIKNIFIEDIFSTYQNENKNKNENETNYNIQTQISNIISDNSDIESGLSNNKPFKSNTILLDETSNKSLNMFNINHTKSKEINTIKPKTEDKQINMDTDNIVNVNYV